jgi:hypothetical protein
MNSQPLRKTSETTHQEQLVSKRSLNNVQTLTLLTTQQLVVNHAGASNLKADGTMFKAILKHLGRHVSSEMVLLLVVT